VTKDLKRTAGVFIETAWAGAGYYLLWFMLAGHVSFCLCLSSREHLHPESITVISLYFTL
jgi:hypothetical protein